jgi:hypothetical protein
LLFAPRLVFGAAWVKQAAGWNSFSRNPANPGLTRLGINTASLLPARSAPLLVAAGQGEKNRLFSSLEVAAAETHHGPREG